MKKRQLGLWAQVTALWCVILSASMPAWANDLNKGYTFAVNEHNVTGTKINNLVDLASINTTFLTDKSAETSPQGADLFLMYSASSAVYKKCSLSSLLLANLNLITSQTEDFAPATNDYLLTYSTANSAFRKASLQNLVFTNAGLIALQPRSTNAPLPGTLVLMSSNGVYNTYALTNLFAEWWRWMPFSTNVAPSTNFLFSLHTHPTNNDGLLIWDSQNATNKVTTLIGLVTNLPVVAVAGLTNTDMLPIVSTATNVNNPYGTNPTLSQISVTNLLPRVWTNALLACDTASGVTTLTHTLPARPDRVRITLVLTNTARLGYSQNDEIELAGVHASTATFPSLYSVSCDASHIVLAYPHSSLAWELARKDTGALSAITKVDWNVRVYAYYFRAN